MHFKVTLVICLAAVANAQAPTDSASTQTPIYDSQSPFYPFSTPTQDPLYLPQAPLNIPSIAPNPLLNPYREEEYGPAQYQFNYEVNSPESGDVKSQQEEVTNNALKGTYSFVQPDGLLRIVEYFDNGYGFVATVRYEPSSVRIPQPPPRAPLPLAPVEPLLENVPVPISARYNGRFLK